ncbi:cupin domain-containing protein [Aliamphritea ceti]|uniref:cupin domain-containing protein n=1 Tax=Aliamphritea ceti TaxID=1524258 RepID=UPI0021C478D7|nr:cupin domain-containing protein [Aliamphritea ceti]
MSNVFKLDPNGINGQTLEPSDYVTAENLTSGTAVESAQTFLISNDEKFSIGVWECSPCCEEIAAYPGDEYCRVMEGAVEITVDGNTERYEVGDSFAIKKGTRLTWNMTSQFKKYFVLYC